MGTGKTSVGRLVASQLHYEFADTDDLIEKRAGKSIAQIFAQDGEPAFRELERQLVAEMAGWRRQVISTGGGLAANEANLASLKQHALVVCLWATPEAIWKRVRSQTHRPLLQGPDPVGKIRALLEERTPFLPPGRCDGEHRSSFDEGSHPAGAASIPSRAHAHDTP